MDLFRSIKAGVPAALLGVLFLICGDHSRANAITWTLSTDVPLSDGGTLNGTFTVNQYGYVNGNFYFLQTAGGSTNFSQTYTGSLNASDPNVLTVIFYAPSPAYSSQLDLVFTGSLLVDSANNALVGGLGGPSWECEGYAGSNTSCSSQYSSPPIRYVTGGYASSIVASTPLPAAWTMFVGGCAGLGFIARKRKRLRGSV